MSEASDPATGRRLPPALVALTPGTLTAPGIDAFARQAAAAVDAGLRGIVVREPALADRDLLSLARRLAESLRDAGGWLCVHDRVHLVTAAGASAGHVGFRSLPVAEAREVLAEELALGLSSHAGDDPSLSRGADYLFFGPVFDTPSKRGVKPPAGLGALGELARMSDLPVLAIGGIRPEHASDVLASGAAGIAVLGGVFGAGDPAGATRDYLSALAAARNGDTAEADA